VPPLPEPLARAYAACEALARSHYENFPVASRLLPAPMRPHVAAVYAFARVADDIADEGTDAPEQRRGARGISAFIVTADTPGLRVGKKEDKMGLRASPTTQILLENVRVPGDALLGRDGMGFVYAMQSLDSGRLGIAAQAIGIARAAFEHAVRYAGERQQFGKPLKELQAIQFKLADMAMRLSASRALLHAAAAAKDRGEPITRYSAMAKLMASETAMFVTDEAIQVFGGYGYMKDFPVERLLRDAKATEIYEGTSEIQRILIARGLYGHGSADA
jgi:alkylation response protein AidB-like acyl-CoA dehydrogenase